MDNVQPSPTPEDQEADQALHDARTRFIAGFTQRLSALGVLLESIERGSDAALVPLQQAAHKLAGLGGVLGFPTVSEHAAQLEETLLQPTLDPAAVRVALDRMGAGFTHDLSGRAPSWAIDADRAAQPARILLVEDDQEQRRVAAAGLRAAGYRVVTAESGIEAVESARLDPPDLILLDVDLPDLDGMAVCRHLKLEPILASVPLIFCTARASLMDRMAGLTLGADDYITKPYVPAELLIRIKRLVSRPAPAPPAPAVSGGLLPYDLFATTARSALAKGPASLLLVRVGASALDDLGARCSDDVRRRDILGRVDDTHLVLLAPDLSPAAARAAMQAIIDRAPKVGGTAIGVADASANTAGTDALDAMLAQADLSLAAERVAQSGGQPGRITVLLSEDDPDVLHIIDARLRAAGYRTILALDGQQTLDVLARETPALLLLDLMMPKLTGFDVLMKLRERTGARPRTIVVSARGRDEDVTRAFELGADDYVTKPFNPEELMARIARLVR